MANSNVLEDYDADCIADDQDNCLLDGNPEGSYNPDQFDGNQNEIGQPCDKLDSVEESSDERVASGSLGALAFNIAGEYELVSPACPDFGDLSLDQNDERVRAVIGNGDPLTGTATLDADTGVITARVKAETLSCDTRFELADTTMEFSCANLVTGELCQGLGEKTLTRLWTDGW